jgi:hypothetical protein
VGQVAIALTAGTAQAQQAKFKNSQNEKSSTKLLFLCQKTWF